MHPHWKHLAILLVRKIAVNNAPEFDEEFIECFAYTRFKIHWISAAIVAEVENDWLMVLCLFSWILGSSFWSSDTFAFDSLDASGEKD